MVAFWVWVRHLSHDQNPGRWKVSKGRSQPEIAAGIRLLNSLRGSG